MKKSRADKEYPQIRIGIGIFAFVCIILGFVIFVGTDYVLSLIEGTKFSLLVTLIKGLSSIAFNLILIAFISLLLELSSIKDYINYVVQQAIIDIEELISSKYSWNFSNASLDELKQYLNVILIEITQKIRESKNIHISDKNDKIFDMINQYLPKLINTLVDSEYYEDYCINLYISIENNNLVKFNNTTSYLVNNSVKKTFKFRSALPTQESYKSLHFEKLYIYSKDRKHLYFDLTSEINRNIKLVEIRNKQNHHNVYCVKSSVDFDNLSCNDYYVEYTRTYLKPIKNGIFVHSFPQLVKDFQANIFLENDSINKYKLYGLSFCPYKQVSNQTDLKMTEQSNGPHSLTIRNSNWCLPGGGISITVMENLELL